MVGFWLPFTMLTLGLPVCWIAGASIALWATVLLLVDLTAQDAAASSHIVHHEVSSVCTLRPEKMAKQLANEMASEYADAISADGIRLAHSARKVSEESHL